MVCKVRQSFLTAEQARLQSRNEAIIYGEICAIQQQIVSATLNGKFDVRVDGTPITSNNNIQSILITNPGVGYSTIDATAQIVHSTGTGATVSPIITGGAVSGFTITNPGSGYEPLGPVLDTSAAGNGDAEIQLFESGGQIVSTIIQVPGSGYTIGDVLPVVHLAGSGANLTVAAVNGTGGITAINIIDPGTGYNTEIATIIVNHLTGINFQGLVEVTGGTVTGITIVNGGLGYGTLKPTASFSDVSGSGAEADVILSQTGSISQIDILNGGSGYSQNVIVTIQDVSGGSGSSATAQAIVNGGTTDSQIYHRVFTGQTTDLVIQDQLDQILHHFQGLGYNIQIEVNPDTQNTIQWRLYW